MERRSGERGCGVSGEGETFHLCQPDPGKSCGACCGLYNYADSTRDSLSARLRARTRRFLRTGRSPEELHAFSSWVAENEDPAKRYEVIYCCEFLGFLDDGERRVGCLLHPAGNNGSDLREISFYGRELCHGHLCPSYTYLAGTEKEVLIAVLDDWYLYGLCVTDIDFVKQYVKFVANRLGQSPPGALFRKGAARQAAQKFLSLKVRWPFRDPSVNRLGKYYFDGSSYMIGQIDYGKLGCEPSRYDAIFVSLSSVFASRTELRRAEEMVEAGISETVRILQDTA